MSVISSRLEDHPRLRGEHVCQLAPAEGYRGSPPPARGALIWRIFSSSSQGITPACAGSIRSAVSGAVVSWDHPRLRGEHRNGK